MSSLLKVAQVSTFTASVIAEFVGTFFFQLIGGSERSPVYNGIVLTVVSSAHYAHEGWLSGRCILAPKNTMVEAINKVLGAHPICCVGLSQCRCSR